MLDSPASNSKIFIPWSSTYCWFLIASSPKMMGTKCSRQRPTVLGIVDASRPHPPPPFFTAFSSDNQGETVQSEGAISRVEPCLYEFKNVNVSLSPKLFFFITHLYSRNTACQNTSSTSSPFANICLQFLSRSETHDPAQTLTRQHVCHSMP